MATELPLSIPLPPAVLLHSKLPAALYFCTSRSSVVPVVLIILLPQSMVLRIRPAIYTLLALSTARQLVLYQLLSKPMPASPVFTCGTSRTHLNVPAVSTRV